MMILYIALFPAFVIFTCVVAVAIGVKIGDWINKQIFWMAKELNKGIVQPSRPIRKQKYK